jgi:hypothetical protein
MMRPRTIAAMMAAVLALGGPAAANGNDPLRCEAVAMRRDGQRYECLVRCERRHTGRDDATRAAATGLATCRQACETRYLAAMEHVDGLDICTAAKPDADPNRCRARLLRAGASRLTCRAQCAAEAGTGAAGCTTACDTQCAAAVDRILAKHFCQGQAGNGVCAEVH